MEIQFGNIHLRTLKHVWSMRRLEMSSFSGKFLHSSSTRERQWRNCYAYLKFIFSCKNTHTYYILLIANSALNVDFSTLIPRFSFKAHALSKSRLKPDRTWTSKNITIDVNKKKQKQSKLIKFSVYTTSVLIIH